MITRRRLFISFSGGRTSALMTMRLLSLVAHLRDLGIDIDVVVIFANTGQEDEETLRFVDRCDRILGFNVVWLQAVIDPRHGKGTRHEVVSFETAARASEPFEDEIAKYGLPNRNYPHCTRELKLAPMYSYLRDIGWEAGSFTTAIGIRADERDRVSVRADEKGIIYPLVRWGMRKPDVIERFKLLPFDLYLPEHMGNCLTCWKKTLRKHLTLIKQRPEAYDFAERMETEYGLVKQAPGQPPRRMFREGRSVADLRAEAAKPFDEWRDDHEAFDPQLDVGGACEESCEVHSDDDEAMLGDWSAGGADLSDWDLAA